MRYWWSTEDKILTGIIVVAVVVIIIIVGSIIKDSNDKKFGRSPVAYHVQCYAANGELIRDFDASEAYVNSYGYTAIRMDGIAVEGTPGTDCHVSEVRTTKEE